LLLLSGRGEWRARLEGEPEGAEVVVEAEDGCGAALRRGDGADAVGEGQGQPWVALHHVPGSGVELGVGVADDQAPGLDRLLEQAAERERGGETGVEAEPGRRLGDDEVGGEEDVTRVAERRVVVANALVRAVAPPEKRDERARVGVDDPQTRSFGAP
jgi:ADP-ribose pyrophosphatase YjhB (NUDIX family)